MGPSVVACPGAIQGRVGEHGIGSHQLARQSVLQRGDVNLVGGGDAGSFDEREDRAETDALARLLPGLTALERQVRAAAVDDIDGRDP